MITHGNEIKLFAGNSNRPLAESIAKKLGTELGDVEVCTFSDGEISVHLSETVRGRDLFIIQSTSYPVNDNLMELLIMIDAAKRASAGRITAVMPYFGYARQDRKARSRVPSRQSDREYSRKSRSRQSSHHGSSCGSDSGLLRYPRR